AVQIRQTVCPTDGLQTPIRGGGHPIATMAIMPDYRMDPPPGASPSMRMTASWSGPTASDRIQVRGAMIRALWRAPLGLVICPTPVAVGLPPREKLEGKRALSRFRLTPHSLIQVAVCV